MMSLSVHRIIHLPHSSQLRWSVIALLLAVSVGYGLASLLALADWRWIVIVSVFAGAVVIGFQILRQWRLGITAFFIWIVVEDLVRKYLGNQIILYAAKDLLIITTYVSFFLWWKASGVRGWKNPLEIPLLVCLAVAVVNCFNAGIDHPAIPLIGLRMNFLYLPLLLLGYVYFDSEARVRRFLMLSLGLGGIVALLGLMQSLVGLGFLNPGGFVPGLRLELIRVTPETQLMIPRPNSVFVDAGRFSQYLFVLFYLGLGAISSWRHQDERHDRAGAYVSLGKGSEDCERRFPWEMAKRSRSPRWMKGKELVLGVLFRRGLFVWICFGLIGAGLFVSAQRAVFVLVALSFVLIAAIACLERVRSWVSHADQRPFPFLPIVICSTIALGIYSLIRSDHLLAIYRFCVETISPLARETELSWRPYVYWQDIVKAVKESGWIGHGTGTASLGLQYVYDLDYLYSDQLYPYAIEGGYAAVIWEVGLLGLAVWLWWTGRLVLASVQTTLSLRRSRFYWMGVSLSVFFFSFLFPYFYLGVQVYQNYVINAYHWFLCGLLFRLPTLGRQRETDPEVHQTRRFLAVRA